MHIWHEGMDPRVEASGAYWERNMLALLMATRLNEQSPIQESQCAHEDRTVNSGWYVDTENNWDGWKRVVSLDNGQYCFHVPDDLDLGKLPEIENNWDGHQTEEKWLRVHEAVGSVDRRSLNQWAKRFGLNVTSYPHSVWVLGTDHFDKPIYTQAEFQKVLMDCTIEMKLSALEGVNQLCLGDKIK